MSLQEAKKEIVEIIEDMPERQVFGVLEYLREMKKLSELDKEAASHLVQIMEEDNDLLKQLAQ